MAYAPDVAAMFRRAADYVDKIHRGAKPSDLPIEQMSNYELIIDLRVAQELKIEVPQEILFRADEVIR